jgi:triacylglycerol esterase/lipase EstA (alpha/beta hydrolase family)
MRRWGIVVAATAAMVATCAAAPAFARSPSTRPLRVIYNGIYGYAHVSSKASPPGANRWSCRPSAAHPYPVILVHGTFGDMSDSWQALSPLLYDNGYCVFALNYGASHGSNGFGVYGIAEISRSAHRLASFVQTVLQRTGAPKVDIVGHSQGGMMPRYYINFLGGDTKVNTLVGLAPSNHGTTLNGLLTLASLFPGASALVTANCAACREQEAGSAFLTRLNRSGETRSAVHYTVIASKYDEVVTPYRSAFLAGAHVTNIVLQRQCRLDLGEHLSMPYDHIAATDVLNALDPSARFTTICRLVGPVSGG